MTPEASNLTRVKINKYFTRIEARGATVIVESMAPESVHVPRVAFILTAIRSSRN